MSLHLLILIPMIGGFLAWGAQRISPALPRQIAVLVLLVAAAVLIAMTDGLNLADVDVLATDGSTWLHHEKIAWIPRFGINYELALDGLSLILVALSLLLGVIAVISSWSEIDQQQGFFHANVLWTITGIVGVFLAMDLFLFFLFWEVMLVPMYLLIAIWGHENRGYAAMKFFIFTQVSGLLMLLSILVLADAHEAVHGVYSFSYFDLLATPLREPWAIWVLGGFLAAFLVKLPAFPVHTWLPDAHTQAPTAGSVILAGILLKTGAYGLIRFAVPLFPAAAAQVAPLMMALGAAGVLYGAVLAFAQTDFKRLVAYSSVAHMGFVLLGVFTWNVYALQGAVMQMVAHGFSTAALFMIAGALQHRLHTRDMNAMGGLWAAMPRMGAVTMFFVIASLGMPGLGNFIAEFLVLMGLFRVNPWLCAISALGLITAAIYSLILLQRAFLGTLQQDRQLVDFGARDMSAMAVMMLGLLWLGLFPQTVLDIAQPVLDSLSVVVGGDWNGGGQWQ